MTVEAEQAPRSIWSKTGGIGIRAHQDSIETLAFLPDESWLISVDETGRILAHELSDDGRWLFYSGAENSAVIALTSAGG